jgi:hypothetical protein
LSFSAAFEDTGVLALGDLLGVLALGEELLDFLPAFGVVFCFSAGVETIGVAALGDTLLALGCDFGVDIFLAGDFVTVATGVLTTGGGVFLGDGDLALAFGVTTAFSPGDSATDNEFFLFGLLLEGVLLTFSGEALGGFALGVRILDSVFIYNVE